MGLLASILAVNEPEWLVLIPVQVLVLVQVLVFTRILILIPLTTHDLLHLIWRLLLQQVVVS